MGLFEVLLNGYRIDFRTKYNFSYIYVAIHLESCEL